MAMRPTRFGGRAHAENSAAGGLSTGAVADSEEEIIQHTGQVVWLLVISGRVSKESCRLRGSGPRGSHLDRIAGSNLAM